MLDVVHQLHHLREVSQANDRDLSLLVFALAEKVNRLETLLGISQPADEALPGVVISLEAVRRRRSAQAPLPDSRAQPGFSPPGRRR